MHDILRRLPIAHADLYRLRDPDELPELGLRERRGDGALVIAEWGRPYLDALGGDALVIAFSLGAGPSAREARLTPTGARSGRLAM